MVSFNSQVPSPYAGYYNSGTTKASPVGGVPTANTAPAPTPAPAYKPDTGLSAQAAIDLLRVVKHPIQTIKSLAICTKDMLTLQGRKNVAIASSDAVMGDYKAAKQHLDDAPFKNILPFFDRALDKWADARFNELKPQVAQYVTDRAWHPISLEWPDGGKGGDRLTELDMLRRTVESSTDGQVVRALQGANRVQIKDSNAVDYFYPIARANDALILRRNLPLVPGQKPIETSFKDLLSQVVQVHIEIQ
jgi:hypothetical protein